MWATRIFRASRAWAPHGRRAQSALAQLRCILEGELESIRGAGTWKSERIITTRQGPSIHVEGVPGGNSPPGGSAEPFAGGSEVCTPLEVQESAGAVRRGS